MFYFWAALLVGAGCALVALALHRRGRARDQAGPESTVAALYQDRLQELRGEIRGGLAEADDRETLEEELGAALLTDYEELAGSHAAPVAADRPARWLPIAGAAGMLAVVLLVYGTVGDPQAMKVAGAEQLLGLDPAADAAELGRWRERLEERVDARPGDARSWYLLGHADLMLGRYASAAEAFAMAHQAYGDDPSIDLFWLRARYLAARGQMDATTRAIAERLLAGDPNQPMVLEMLAVEAYREEDYPRAVNLLNRALSGELAPRQRQALQVVFDEARRKLGQQAASVDVAIETQGEVPADATLFVIARPVGGGMPFAVVRRPVGGFPGTIRLDDAVSMNPAAPLSGAREVEVVVRLSRSGTAMAHPGDWEWRSSPLRLDGGGGPFSLTATLKPPS